MIRMGKAHYVPALPKYMEGIELARGYFEGIAVVEGGFRVQGWMPLSDWEEHPLRQIQQNA